MTLTLLNTPTAGNIVVPLRDILERLEGRLEPAEIEGLLYAILSKKRGEVRPGDLITADLMNQVLRDLALLEAKVAALSVGRPDPSTGVKISQPTASTIVRVGQPLVIRGENLLADSSVFIENKPISDVIGSHDTTKLTLRQVPSLDLPGGISESGTRVQLLVVNDAGHDSTEFIIKPGVLAKPIGKIVVTVSDGPDPGTKFEAGKSYPFTFKISADTKPDADYLITGAVGSTGWTVRPSKSEIFIAAAPDARTPTVKSVEVTVEVPGTAQTGEGGNLTVTVTAKDDATFKWSSQPVAIKVDATAAAVHKLALTPATTTGDAALRAEPDGSKTAIIGSTAGARATGGVRFNVTRTDNTAFAAGDYQVDLAKLKVFTGDEAQPKWSAKIPGSPNGIVTLPAANARITVEITAKPNAPDATLVLEVAKVGDNTVTAHHELKVESA